MNTPTPPLEKGIYVRISLPAHHALKIAAKAAKRSMSAQAAVDLEEKYAPKEEERK